MTIGVAEEGADLVAPIDGRGEELCPAGAQYLVGSQAVRRPDDQLTGDPVWVDGRGKGHHGLVFRRIASNSQHDFTTAKAQEAQGIGNFANDRGSQHVAIEGQRASVVAHYKEELQIHTGGWEVIC